MELPVAKNFNEYTAVIAANSPPALVLDCWRRLDLALHDYGNALKPVVDHQNRHAIERAISQDHALGPALAALIRELRLLRNRTAHGSICLSPDDAAAYARQAFSLIAALARRVAHLQGAA